MRVAFFVLFFNVFSECFINEFPIEKQELHENILISLLENITFLKKEKKMLHFKAPSTTLVVGVSQSGKTCLVRKMIRENIYEKTIKKVKWIYLYAAPWFLEEPNIEFVQGMPETFDDCDLIVIDDMMHHLNDRVADLFTATSHHRNLSVILILQNLFPKAKVARDISLNAHYIIVFKNARDMNQVNCLARQLYPNNSRFLMDAYIKATAKPYNYLLIDCHPSTPEEYRLRESVFSDPSGIHWVFRPK